MKSYYLLALLFVSILFGCNPEEYVSHSVEFQTDTFTMSRTGIWRDTIHFSNSSGSVNELFFKLIGIEKDVESNWNSNGGILIDIVEKTASYLVYEIPSQKELFPLEYVKVVCLSNGEIISEHDLSVKWEVTSNVNSESDLDPNEKFIIYKSDVPLQIKKYNTETQETTVLVEITNNIYLKHLSLSPNNYHFIIHDTYNISLYLINGVLLKDGTDLVLSYINPENLGFNSNGNIYYVRQNYAYTYLDFETDPTQVESIRIVQGDSKYMTGYAPITTDEFFYIEREGSGYSTYSYQIKDQNDSVYFDVENIKETTYQELVLAPNEQYLLFTENNRKVYELDIATKKLNVLYTAPDVNGRIDNIDFSGDGQFITFDYYDGNQSDIYTMNADGSNSRNLTNTSSISESNPNWK